MAMVASRLFNRARQLCASKALMPSLPIPMCTTHAYSAIQSKELRGTKKKLTKKIDEEMWNFRRHKAEQDAKEGGSPFCFTTLEDHVSTDNASSNPKEKKLEKWSRCRKHIMKYLHFLIMDEVLYSEKRYMEHLINEFNHWEFVDEWWNEDYVILEPYCELFTMLPQGCLRRGLQLHMSRIPYRYSKKSLDKVMKNKLLRKLEEDYKLLTLKIHDFPIKSEEVMAREIHCFVDNLDPGPKCYALW